MLIHGCLTLFIDSINKMKDGCSPIYIISHFFVAKLEYLLFQNLNYDN